MKIRQSQTGDGRHQLVLSARNWCAQRQYINRTIKDLVRSREVLDEVITTASDGQVRQEDIANSADRDP